MNSATAERRDLAIEAEQALIGAALVNNDVYARCAAIVRPEHFGDPLHADVWERIGEQLAQGVTCSALTLRARYENHDGMAAVGGPGYLARLYGAAEVTASPDIARAIRDRWIRRTVADAADKASHAMRAEGDAPTARVIADLEAELIALSEATASGPRDGWAGAAVASFMSDMWTAYHAEEGLLGVTTGVESVDQKLGGWRGGRLVILGGRPGMGKSVLLLFFAYAAASAGKGVHLCSLEMSPAEISARLLSLDVWRHARQWVAYDKIMRVDLAEGEARLVAEAAVRIDTLPLRITGPDVRDLGALAASCRRSAALLAARDKRLDLVLVDYLQLVRAPRQRQSVVHEVADVSAGLKGLALMLDAPVIAAAQLSRGVEQREDKRPVLSDLRDSGAIEQDADMVIFAYRHEYYLARAKPEDSEKLDAWLDAMEACRNRIELGVAKHRHGRTCTLDLWCDVSINAVAEVR